MKLVNAMLVVFGLVAVGCSQGSSDAADEATTSADLSTAAAAWEMLGETRVDGNYDQDVLPVGVDDGRFDSIQIRVDGSALVMFEIKVVFGNGETFEPNVRFIFDQNTRSRVIDLPGNTRFIRRVEFKYGNVPGGSRARVELWGRNQTPPPQWEELGERRVDGTFDHDTIDVGGSEEGPFTAIQVRVKRSSLVMENIRVTFGNGEVFQPQVRLVFDENTRSRVIDLPGTQRFIKRVDFSYANLPGGGDASVELWGAL
jgi:hypothetical protein